MSNNIYDILKTMQNLEAPKQTLTESKMSTVKELHNEGKKKKPTNKGSIAEAVNTVESQLNEKYMGFKKAAAAGKNLGEDSLDFLRSPEGIAKNRDKQARSEQDFADRSAKHFAGQIGDQYHKQLIKTNPAYRDEYMSRVKDVRMPDTMRRIEKELQAKYDPMGGPTNIDYEKIKQNPMATRAGEAGSDFRPWGPGPKERFDSDQFGRPVREGEMEESGLQAYLGKKKYGKEGMQALQQAGREGASKEKMAKIRARHDKMDEDYESMMKARDKESRDKEFQADMDFVKSGGGYTDTSGTTYDRFGNPLADGGKTRAKDAKNRDYPVYRTPGVGSGSPDRSVPGKMDEGAYNEDMLSPKEKEFAALAEPKDKITYADKIAGAKKGVKKEGNKFSGNLMKARAQGLKKADLDGDGDMEPVRESAFAVADEEHQAAIQKMQIGKLLMREGWEEMQKYLEKKRGPESKGGAGKKAGTRYGGSAQKDDDEDTDGEGKPVEKKKGRPKGTGGGAKFSFKKPKD